MSSTFEGVDSWIILVVILFGVVLPGVAGAVLARARGFRAYAGFGAGAVGGIGGLMLVAVRPGRAAPVRAAGANDPARRRRLDAADRAAHALYRVLGVVFVLLNLVWLSTTLAAVLAPMGFRALLAAEPGLPVRAVDYVVLALLAALWMLCVYTAATDRRLTRGARVGWLAGLVAFVLVSSLVYLPWRRARLPGRA